MSDAFRSIRPLLLCAIALWTAASPAAAPPATADVDRLFERWSAAGSPGVSVLVVSDGRTVYQKSFGYAQLENAQPIGPDTVFWLASVSKQFTAMGILLLQQRGLLALDDRVAEYLPHVVPAVARDLTLRQLLYHTSGLRDQFDLFQLAGHGLGDVVTQDEVLALIAQQQGLNFAPGSRYQYTNSGYTLLAAVIEKLTGQPFAGWMQRELFAPLGMAHTRFVDDHTAVIAHRAESYRRTPDGTPHRSPLNLETVGATGAVSTIGDLGIWARFIIDGASGTLRVPLTFYEAGQLSDGTALSYGAGVFVEQVFHRRALEHGGSDASFRSHLLVFPDDGNAVILLANTDDAPLAELARQVASMLFDLGGAAPAVQEPVPPSHQAADARTFAGQYAMEDGSLVTVVADADMIGVQVGAAVTPLRPTGAGAYRVGDSEVTVTFSRTSAPVPVDAISVVNSGVSMKGQRLRPHPVASSMLSSLTGSYYSAELDRYVDVAIAENGLRLTLPDRRSVPLGYFGDDTFRGTAAPVMVRFERDPAGTVRAARLSGMRVKHLEFIKAERPAARAALPVDRGGGE